MADWLKPRQHICVALATVCWTGADHWIQMWKSFGVPISDFMNATPFFPPSEFLNSDTMKFIWRNPTHRPCTQFKRHQVVETLRVVTPIWSKTSGQMWWGHFHELLILLGKHLFARIHIWMRFKEKKNADDLLNPRQHNTCSSEKTTHFMENRNQKMLSDDPPPIKMNGLLRQGSQRTCSDWILRGFSLYCGEEFELVVTLSSARPAFPLASAHDTVSDRSVKGISQNHNCYGWRGQHRWRGSTKSEQWTPAIHFGAHP